MHGNTVPDAPTTGSVTLPSLSAPEPEDVKPVIPRPFPMAAPDTPRTNSQNRQRTQISASPATSLSRSPLRRVKREPSLVVTRLVPSSMEPIYISSDEDEDEEEVHKQIEASTSQATSARSSEKEAAVADDQDQEEQDDQEEEGEERRGEKAAEEKEQSTAAEPADEEEHDEDAAEEPKVKEEQVPQGAALENDEDKEEEEGGDAQDEDKEENVPQVAALEEPEEDQEEGDGQAPKDQAEEPEEDELEEDGVDDDKMVEEHGVDDGKEDEDEDENVKLPKEDDDKMAEDEDEDEDEDEKLPAEDDKEEDSEHTPGAEEISEPTHEKSPSKSPSRSPSSSPPPPDPFSLARSSSIPKPQPRPKVPSLSLSQPPPKRRLSSNSTFAVPGLATQPATSSRRSQSRASVIKSRGSTSTAIGNATATDEEELEVEEVEVEEDDKRYAKRPKTQTPFTSTLTGIAPISPTRGKHIAHPKKHLRKHPDYWLLDGSVTLQLESTLFRLHRSRLVTQSTYFQELFAAQPDMLGEGCAYRVGSGEEEEWVYVIKGVSVGDFEELLRALDNAISYVYDPPPFFKLAAILRASLTLHFPSLSSFVIRTLRTTWPVSLSQLTATRIPHAAETIILARTCEGSGLGLHDIMKRAFYELVRTARMGEDVDADEEDPDVMSGQVSRQDLARLIRAREELVSRWVTAAVSPPDIVCSQDGHVPIDKAKLLECWQEKVVRGGVFEEGMYDPIVGLQRLGEVRWEDQVCKGCVGVWREVWEKMRVKLWGQLDLWLGLPEGGGEKEE